MRGQRDIALKSTYKKERDDEIDDISQLEDNNVNEQEDGEGEREGMREGEPRPQPSKTRLERSVADVHWQDQRDHEAGQA